MWYVNGTGSERFGCVNGIGRERCWFKNERSVGSSTWLWIQRGKDVIKQTKMIDMTYWVVDGLSKLHHQRLIHLDLCVLAPAHLFVSKKERNLRD
jgi:hypothetical protein